MTKRHLNFSVFILLGAFVAGIVLAQSHQDLLNSADEILGEVSKLRELEAKAPIKKGIKSREEIKSYLVKRISQEYPPAEIAIEARALAKLGVIPKDLKLYEFMLELLTEQIAGFYDPATDMLYIADWTPLEGQKPVMAHELMHALQDQHFDLSQFIKRSKGNDDAAAARHAIVEGEGFAVMIDYVLKPLGQTFLVIPNILEMQRAQLPTMDQQFQVFATAPHYLREWLLFPYTYGMNFIQAYRREHSWAEVAKLYQQLPESTEQIIHPEKYMIEPDPPTVVQYEPSPELSGKLGKRIYNNVLGEFGTYLVIREFSGETTARRASEGWDGDSLQLFEKEGRLGLVFVSTWDSEKDASEFFQAYRRVLEKKHPTAEKVLDQSQRLFLKSSTDEVYLELTGSKVQAVELEASN